VLLDFFLNSVSTVTDLHGQGRGNDEYGSKGYYGEYYSECPFVECHAFWGILGDYGKEKWSENQM
jgi:hypothetical protein